MPEAEQPVATYAGKEEFARLINDACARLGFIKKGYWDYRALARRAHLHPNTVHNGVSERYVPAVTTLQKLAEVTDVPLQIWLASVGQLPADPAGALDLPPAVEQRIRRMINEYGERYVIRALDWLESAPPREPPPS